MHIRIAILIIMYVYQLKLREERLRLKSSAKFHCYAAGYGRAHILLLPYIFLAEVNNKLMCISSQPKLFNVCTQGLEIQILSLCQH